MPKQQSVDDTVSLFPFLSILACLIGILVLMISAITLGQIGKDSTSPDTAAAAEEAAAAKARAEHYKALRNQTKTDAEAIKDLAAKVRLLEQKQQDAATVAANIAQAKEELAKLTADAAKRQEEQAAAAVEQQVRTAQIAKYEQENKALEEKLKPLLELLAKLKAELALKQGPPQEAQVQIRPSGSRSDLKATFVECAAGSIVLHDRAEPLRIPTAQAGGHPEYLKLLDTVKATPQGTVVYLIRPDGVDSYNHVRHVARVRYVSNGKLAIGGQGKLDLTLFK